MSTLKTEKIKHLTSGTDTLLFDNGGPSGGNGRVPTKGTIGEIIAITYASTITLDLRTANNFSTTLTGNLELANPSNIAAGQSGVIYITQDNTGSRTWSVGSYWHFAGGTLPDLSTAGDAVDALVYHARTSTCLVCDLKLDVKVTS